MMPIIQVNRTGCSVNMIQHKILSFITHTFIEYIYIFASGIYAAIDLSHHMKYSGAGTMLY